MRAIVAAGPIRALIATFRPAITSIVVSAIFLAAIVLELGEVLARRATVTLLAIGACTALAALPAAFARRAAVVALRTIGTALSGGCVGRGCRRCAARTLVAGTLVT